MSTLDKNNIEIASLLQRVHDLPPAAHEDAVLRIPQEMTDTQKWQARANIGAVSEENVRQMVEDASIKTDETLTLKDGVLSVNRANEVGQDNTLPITSAAVYTTVGNIGAILDTI